MCLVGVLGAEGMTIVEKGVVAKMEFAKLWIAESKGYAPVINQNVMRKVGYVKNVR